MLIVWQLLTVSRDEQGVRFRNYLPRDEGLQQHREVGPIIPKFDDPIAKTPAEVDDPEASTLLVPNRRH